MIYLVVMHHKKKICDQSLVKDECNALHELFCFIELFLVLFLSTTKFMCEINRR